MNKPNSAVRSPGTVSLTTYAHMRGAAPQSIWQAVREGRIRLRDGRIDPAEADATWYRRHLQRQDGQRSGAAAEAKREQALLTKAIADVQMTRRKVEQVRSGLVERDKGQAAIGAIVAETTARLAALAAPGVGDDAAIIAEATELAIADLGDLQAEALKVTQRA